MPLVKTRGISFSVILLLSAMFCYATLLSADSLALDLGRLSAAFGELSAIFLFLPLLFQKPEIGKTDCGNVRDTFI